WWNPLQQLRTHLPANLLSRPNSPTPAGPPGLVKKRAGEVSCRDLLEEKDFVHQFPDLLDRRHLNPLDLSGNLLRILPGDKDLFDPGLFRPVDLLGQTADPFDLPLNGDFAGDRDILAQGALQ